MNDFVSYWGIVASTLTAGSATVLYFAKNWRDVEALKEQRRAQEMQIAALLERVDSYHLALTEREAKHKRGFELKLQEYRAEAARELALLRREATATTLRLTERVESLDKLLTVAVERQNQLLDSTRRQEVRNDRLDKLLWLRTNIRPGE